MSMSKKNISNGRDYAPMTTYVTRLDHDKEMKEKIQYFRAFEQLACSFIGQLQEISTRFVCLAYDQADQQMERVLFAIYNFEINIQTVIVTSKQWSSCSPTCFVLVRKDIIFGIRLDVCCTRISPIYVDDATFSGITHTARVGNYQLFAPVTVLIGTQPTFPTLKSWVKAQVNLESRDNHDITSSSAKKLGFLYITQ